MAKNTHAQGASFTEEEAADIIVTRPQMGEVISSPGNSSGQSSLKPSSGNETQSPANQPPAPTTENLSGQTDKEGSDALSTAGDGQETETGSSDFVEAPPYEQWSVVDLKTEIDARNEDPWDESIPPLSKSGNKADLIAALEEDDEEREKYEAAQAAQSD